jgi:SAM-dependent methyltransferase
VRSYNFPLVVERVKTGALSIAEEAPAMIAFLGTLDDPAALKECKAQSAAITEYLAHRKDMGVAEYNAAQKVKARVEHRLGEVLAETVNHNGSRGQLKGDTVSPQEKTAPEEITRKQSSRAQQVARVPWEEIEERIDAATEGNERVSPGRIVRDILEERARAESARSGLRVKLPEGYEILTGDFRQALSGIPDGSVSLILTDPPYDADSVPLYGDLAEHAARVLKPGGSLVAYAGHYALFKIGPLMEQHLRYWWTLALQHGGNSARLPGFGVFVEWKPLLWFVKGRRWNRDYLADLVRGDPPDKLLHDWQQGREEARYIIERLTAPGEVVLDPLCGSGTVCAAARLSGRLAVGVELDPSRANVARKVLADAIPTTAP